MSKLSDRFIEKLESMERDYTVDTTELGEVMAVTSLALLMLSAHAALSLQDSLTQVENTNEELDRVEGIMSSESFQSSMEAVETTAIEISQDFEQVYQGFSSLESTVTSLESVESNLRERYNFYRWLILISIIGVITGLSLIYI